MKPLLWAKIKIPVKIIIAETMWFLNTITVFGTNCFIPYYSIVIGGLF